MNKPEARSYLKDFFNLLPDFCNEIIAVHKRAHSPRATQKDKITLYHLYKQRDRVGDALSVLYRSTSYSAAPSSFPHIDQFIKQARPLLKKKGSRYCLGVIIKFFLELTNFRALNATANRGWWQKKVTQLNYMFRRMV